MAEIKPKRENPFVGPRAIRTGERLYGRDRETTRLYNLLLADRIVLLYSPSGAGKTSLVQAALIPRLEERKFLLMPVARVNLEPDESLAKIEGFNRYAFSVLNSMEEERPEADQIPVDTLAGMRISEYLDQYTDSPIVLILDQFEEILTIDPTDRKDKEQFFDQLGEALRTRTRWALFSMREDYIAGLDPYLLPIPTRLSTTFRLDLLEKDTSRKVIQQIAGQGGVDFSEAAAAKLIDDLCRVQVQRPDGSVEVQTGQYVEPVQMQVVCYNLWEKLDPEDMDITEEDIEKIGDVDQSLGEYYSRQVAEVAKKTGVKERTIREWFDVGLITETGIRGQVLMGKERSDGLKNEAIHLLVNAHMVRRDTRRGTTWFELAHDRLIGPVRRDNTTWFQTNLSLLQRQAALWKKENRSEHLLLRKQALEKAEEWTRANPDDLTPSERDFLEACQEARQREIEERQRQEQAVKLQEQQRLAKVLRGLLIFAIIAAVVAGIFAVATFISGRQAIIARDDNATLAVENATVAGEAQAASTLAVGNAATSAANAGTAQAAEATAVVDRATADAARITANAASDEADAQRATAVNSEAEARQQTSLATSRQLAFQSVGYAGSQPGLASLLGVESYQASDTTEAKTALLTPLQVAIERTIQEFGRPIPGQENDIFAVAISPDGERLAWGDADGNVAVWNYHEGRLERRMSRHEAPVLSLAFSIDGKYLVAGGEDSRIYILDIESGRSNQLAGALNTVQDLSFSPDGKKLAGAVGFFVTVWDFEKRRVLYNLPLQRNTVWSVAWSPDGSMLATGGADKRVVVWDPETQESIFSESKHTDAVYSVTWSPDSKYLASGARDSSFILWDIENGKAIGDPIKAHGEGSVYSVAFSPDGKILATGGGDGTILFTSVSTLEPVGRVENYFRYGVRSLAFRPTGGINLLAAGSFDNSIGLFTVTPQQPLSEEITGDKGQILSVASMENGSILLAEKQNGEVNIWLVVQEEEKLVHNIPSTAISAAFSPAGDRLALGEPSGDIIILEVESGEEVNRMSSSPSAVLALAFSPDGRNLASTQCLEELFERGENPYCNLHELLIWDTASGNIVQTLGVDYSINITQQTSEATEQTSDIVGHTDYIRALAFSPNENFLATGGDDQTIMIWDLETQLPLVLPLTQHKAPVTSMAFSPDGLMLASGSQDMNLILWDIPNFQPIGEPLTGAQGSILSLDFSADSAVLLSGDSGGALLAWDVWPDSWVERNCQQAGRNLSTTEWKQFFPDLPYSVTCPEWPGES